MKKVIIVLVLIIVIGMGGGGTWLYLSNKKPAPLVEFSYDPGEYFVTDISGSNRYLKTDIIIHGLDDKIVEKLTAENYKIRDLVICILRTKTAAQIQSPTIQQDLKTQIVKELNTEFSTETFDTLYFNEFVIQ